MPRTRLRGGGVAVPGLVDRERGTCVMAPNLGCRDVPIRASLTESLGAPATVRNSVQAGALARLLDAIAKALPS